MPNKAVVIGAGFAGCEAAYKLAEAGIKVTLYEQKPIKFSKAHRSENFCELICSNSFKAERLASAAGLLKAEMQILGSLTVETAYKTRVPAGGALSVNREEFSAVVTEKISAHKNITVIKTEITEIPKSVPVIIATGPLTEGMLAEEISKLCGDGLSFYDAAAPIVAGDSVDMDNAFFASRYGRGGDTDYINCPLEKEEYEIYIKELCSAELALIRDFDRRHGVYEGCMPIEVMAKRGPDTVRFGPLKPVGLTNPHTGKRPWAVVQLRREDNEGRLYNLVGFQTNLKFGEQKRVFSLVPALKNAEFIRYGVMHRNTFINSPKLLNKDFSLRSNPDIYFAGQITGVEGYMESAASGIIAGISLARRLNGMMPFNLPYGCMTEALCRHVSESNSSDFQPMGANFGIMPKLGEKIRNKQERYEKMSNKALKLLKESLSSNGCAEINNENID